MIIIVDTSKIMKELKQLHIILFNMKIESARIKEPNGISVISDRMDKIIKNIEKEIVELDVAEPTHK